MGFLIGFIESLLCCLNLWVNQLVKKIVSDHYAVQTGLLT